MSTESTSIGSPRRSTVMRTIGTILLAVGFLALNIAWMITDPFAIDANISPGGLILLGRFTGSVGLGLVAIDAVLLVIRRLYRTRRSN